MQKTWGLRGGLPTGRVSMWVIAYCSFCLAGKRIVQEWSSASRNSLTSGLAMPASPRKIEGVFSPGSAPQRAPVLRAIFSNCAHRPLQLTELLEHKERMVSGEPIVAVEDSAFLLAKGRTVGTVHAKHEGLEPCLLIRPVDQKAGETAQGRASLWPTRALMAGSSRRGLCGFTHWVVPTAGRRRGQHFEGVCCLLEKFLHFILRAPLKTSPIISLM